MKRLVAFILIAVIFTGLAIWSPWLYWKIDLRTLFGVRAPDAISGLQVNSLSGEVEVFVDNQSQGKVKVETSPLTVDELTPGEHLISLKRVTTVVGAYWDLTKVITFEKGSSVVISYNLGPEEQFSEGHVIYAVKKDDNSKPTQLNITTNVADATLQIDSIQPQKISGNSTSQTITLDSQHKLKISKVGFESLEFTILPDTQEDRDKFKNYDINLDVQLMYQPVQVN